MPNEIVPDQVVREHILSEYGQSLATVAEALLRYPDIMSRTTSDSERRSIDAQYARVLRATLDSRPIALAVLEEREETMSWFKKAWQIIKAIVGIGKEIEKEVDEAKKK